MENQEIPSGWPLGLEIMNVRLQVVSSLPSTAAEHYTTFHAPSTSFSSFSSSNLDTESTASFFQDHSVSLGRLIGIRPGERGRLYYPNSNGLEEHGRVSKRGPKGHELNLCPGICIPLLVCALVKSKNNKAKR
ncbi:uncharacterized protein LOC133802630 isoform X2 [Humulus lupulus]|uniref:uncharacterized protein LOC133802630 isoform X2 n=1 Tax=Humulus lupulus TaxID=3486 RepID=UPI002B408413|nr:uncharacterized protein LOC133802630 isoform X2 [Humulus lupulus]